MDVTEKNGQPSMEEILASIRRIIAEEPGGLPNDFNSRPILLDSEDADDGPEFDLPSMFRAPVAQPEKSAPLLGRLTEAIRLATQGTAAPSVELDPAAAAQAPSFTTEAAPSESLSSLNLHRHEAQLTDWSLPEPEARHGEPLTMATSNPPESPPGEEPQRVMVPFKDRTFMKLGASPSNGAPLDPFSMPQPRIEPVRFEFPLAAPQTFEAPKPEPEAAKQPERTASASDASIMPAVQTAAPPVIEVPPMMDFSALEQRAPQEPLAAVPPPPPIEFADRPPPLADAVERASGDAPPATIEDATADLLRPMLRQWLAENMPRMVEKALHIEVAESVKTGKKTTL